MIDRNSIKTCWYPFMNNKYYEKKPTIKIIYNDKIDNRQK